MGLRGYLNKALARGVSRKLAVRSSPGPIVSFTFDDFPRSAMLTAGKMMEERGYLATYYASLGLAGQDSSVGPLFLLDDLGGLVSAGHELACHTFHHVSAHRARPLELQEDCKENRSAVLKLLNGYHLDNFSFPSGDVTLSAKVALSRAYRSCRTVSHGLNGDTIDMSYLLANPIYANQPQIETLIQENARAGSWLIFYTHDVVESPSPFGCTPVQFEQVLNCVVRSGAEILPVRNALARFEQQG